MSLLEISDLRIGFKTEDDGAILPREVMIQYFQAPFKAAGVAPLRQP